MIRDVVRAGSEVACGCMELRSSRIETVGSSSLAMKLLIYSKQLQYYRFEQIRTLRPNVTIPWAEFVPTSESEPYVNSGCVLLATAL